MHCTLKGDTMKGLTERPVDKSCLSLIKQDIACQIKDVIQFVDWLSLLTPSISPPLNMPIIPSSSLSFSVAVQFTLCHLVGDCDVINNKSFLSLANDQPITEHVSQIIHAFLFMFHYIATFRNRYGFSIWFGTFGRHYITAYCTCKQRTYKCNIPPMPLNLHAADMSAQMYALYYGPLVSRRARDSCHDL